PFGKRTLTGYVLRAVETDICGDFTLKAISKIIDAETLITDETAALAKYICESYVCSLGESLACIIALTMTPPKRRKAQSSSAITEKERRNCKDLTCIKPQISSFPLTSYQQNAVNEINKIISSGVSQAFLLRGVTASGKTEVYLNCIEKALSLNKSAIFLIPEISLTPQFVDIVQRRFGELCGVWHSGVSSVQKYELFTSAKSGKIKLMLGARSAIFAPFSNLGLIIIDEEHDRAYKQEQKPSYDAREIAFWRAKYHNAAVVLGSATPSLESFKNALEKKITLLEMPDRIDKKKLPEVKILSLKNHRGGGMLLNETIEAVSETLKRKEQAIVFLNRRGYSPSIMCRKCLSPYQCPSCSVSMVYHRNPDVLKCHYCGQIVKLPAICPACKSREIAVFGTGTQKVEEELKKLFPKAKTLRLDGDTTVSKKSYREAYDAVKNDGCDILVGTQMIAKGFDFPKVSLVCVIDADTALYLPDFKSAERTFQIITQVSGRCGRGETAGKVLVQTSRPDHYAIVRAKDHDFLSFYNEETLQRKKFFYPPYCDLAKITLKHKNEDKAERESEFMFSALCKFIENEKIPLKLLGPAPAYISKLNNTYRKHIIIKGDKEDILSLAVYAKDYVCFYSDSQISIEISPQDLI
ncbi:MAG: primosomal protein N', partial [Endomicrobium sp.]|nr:primosomal protein N' [Endomicrobium sp.]